MGLRPHFAFILGTDTVKYQPHPKWNTYQATCVDPRIPQPLDMEQMIPIPSREYSNRLHTYLDDMEKAPAEVVNRALRDRLTEAWMYECLNEHDRKEYKEHREEGSSFYLWNFLFQQFEHSLPEVIGIYIDHTRAARLLDYAMLSAYPEFQTNGYKFLPSLSIDEDRSTYAGLLKLRRELDDKPEDRAEFDRLIDDDTRFIDQKEQFINQGINYQYFAGDMEVYRQHAEYIFNLAGITIDPTELRLMLVWYWS